ncbi:NADP(H)-dependent aldo-keto reductase [Methylophaga sulfidovorans]|uniref:Protein tas n=1 Tax=Methylophaga sulfidovorans TaxID=45496 RepID=A0A1I3VGA6_9GAMM|nr:NADP(H)-dependent aldo-keto reductase [Methylophaga sulfidovorans]SFJ94444.1 Predicted oxidoreductase [Methylophaga sulfidovorans]
MQYNTLGNTDLNVSRICLGTMTFGEQNTEQEGHEQLDYAVSQGVNFIDTAELYAIPPCAETYGATEEIIGNWLQKRGRRDDIILASKMAGPGGDWVSHIRGGGTRFEEKTIEAAVDASLKRLKTDYIDLYQLHWPERNTNYFGRLGYQQAADEQNLTPIIDTLQGLKKQILAGKIRHIGLSNETPWGIMQFITLAKAMDLPLVVSVQNPYSLLNRTYEIGCAEISHREQVGLLAYSPLGFGVLTGKYLNEQPENSRLTRWPNYSRYSNPQAVEATRRYVELARRFQLDPAQMALAFVNSRPFLTTNIIGATSMEQLKNNIASEELTLTEELLAEIELIHQSIPNPAP